MRLCGPSFRCVLKRIKRRRRKGTLNCREIATAAMLVTGFSRSLLVPRLPLTLVWSSISAIALRPGWGFRAKTRFRYGSKRASTRKVLQCGWSTREYPAIRQRAGLQGSIGRWDRRSPIW